MAKVRVYSAGDPPKGTSSSGGFGVPGGLSGGLGRLKVGTLDVFNQGVNTLEAQIHRAPPDLQPQARRAVAAAREWPWLTMAGLAAVGLVLARGGRKKR